MAVLPELAIGPKDHITTEDLRLCCPSFIYILQHAGYAGVGCAWVCYRFKALPCGVTRALRSYPGLRTCIVDVVG